MKGCFNSRAVLKFVRILDRLSPRDSKDHQCQNASLAKLAAIMRELGRSPFNYYYLLLNRTHLMLKDEFAVSSATD
jgi:hypothetical protein